MTRILIVYGTTDGYTSKVAQALGRALGRAGAEAEIFPASPAAPDPGGYAGVIVAASLHNGAFQAPVRQWLKQHVDALDGVPSAFVCVCMMARDPRDGTRLKLYRLMRNFADVSGWQPSYFKPVAGALRYTQYGWLRRWMVKRIAAVTGADTDTSRDHEYTDWNDLDRFARSFAAGLNRVREPRRAHVA
jgi:menaquinone-dependent protoporphyrinogen oxidase